MHRPEIGNVKYAPKVEKTFGKQVEWETDSTRMLMALNRRGNYMGNSVSTFVRPDQSIVDKRRAKNKVARKQRKVNAHK